MVASPSGSAPKPTYRLVTISGLPGSGTTTLARAVAAAAGLEHLDAGTIFRRLAAERGMDVAELGRWAADHPEADVELDARIGERARAGDCVLEGRLAGWVVTREAVSALRVWVVAAEEVRAARVAGREGSDPDAALAQNRAREASERERYTRTYGIDLADLGIYDLVLDSAESSPDELADAVLGAFDRE